MFWKDMSVLNKLTNERRTSGPVTAKSGREKGIILRRWLSEEGAQSISSVGNDLIITAVDACRLMACCSEPPGIMRPS